MAIRSWEVKLETSGGVITETVMADDFEMGEHGVEAVKETESGESEGVAFFPYTKLLGIKEVTP